MKINKQMNGLQELIANCDCCKTITTTRKILQCSRNLAVCEDCHYACEVMNENRHCVVDLQRKENLTQRDDCHVYLDWKSCESFLDKISGFPNVNQPEITALCNVINGIIEQGEWKYCNCGKITEKENFECGWCEKIRDDIME